MSVALFLGIIPAHRLPLLLRVCRALVPSTYAVDALAEGFAPSPSAATVALDLAVCAAVALVSLAVASLAWRRAVRR
jgi:ABC-2 type transport system permease protein